MLQRGPISVPLHFRQGEEAGQQRAKTHTGRHVPETILSRYECHRFPVVCARKHQQRNGNREDAVAECLQPLA